MSPAVDHQRLTRRGLVGGAATGAFGVVALRGLPGSASEAKPARHRRRATKRADVVYVNGQRAESPAGGPLNSRALAPLLADAKVPFTELDSMAASVPPDSPWEASHAAEWDAMTVETWKQQNTVSPTARFLI